MDKLYSGRMEPAMREYLKTLREQSYVVIKPGFQDIAGGGGSEIQEVSATPEVSKQKKARKKFLLFGKKSESEHEVALRHRSQLRTEHHYFFLVHEKEIRNTREGKPYLRLELGDRSGSIEARMWDQFDVAAKDIGRDDFVKVNARVEIYRNKPQLSLQQLRLAKPEEVDLADFLPTPKKTSASSTPSFWNMRARSRIPG